MIKKAENSKQAETQALNIPVVSKLFIELTRDDLIKFKADFEFDNYHEEAFEDECEITIYDICVKNFYNINGIPLTNIMDYLDKNFKDTYRL